MRLTAALALLLAGCNPTPGEIVEGGHGTRTVFIAPTAWASSEFDMQLLGVRAAAEYCDTTGQRVEILKMQFYPPDNPTPGVQTRFYCK